MEAQEAQGTYEVLPDDDRHGQEDPHGERNAKRNGSRGPHFGVQIVGVRAGVGVGIRVGVLQCLEGEVVGRDRDQKRQPVRARGVRRCVALERGEQGLHQEEDQIGPFKGGPTVLRG